MYSFTLSFFLSILLDILQYRLFKILSSLFFASSDNSLYRYHFIFGGSFVVILIILFRPASVSFPVFCTAMLVSAQSFWCIIFHHCNNPFFSCNPILNSVNVYSYWQVFCQRLMLLDDILKIIWIFDSGYNSNFSFHAGPDGLNLLFLYNFFIFFYG